MLKMSPEALADNRELWINPLKESKSLPWS